MESAVSSLSTLSQGGSIGHQRKRHADLQEKLQGLWSTSKLFERALANFEGAWLWNLSFVHYFQLLSLKFARF